MQQFVLFNFLIISTSYCRWIENSQSSIDYLRLGDEILKYLDLNFRPRDGRSIASIARSLRKDDSVQIKEGRLASFLRMIDFTFRWLKGAKEQKKEIEDEIDALEKNAYKRALKIGIKCMKEDGITSWKRVVKLAKEASNGKNYKEKIESCYDLQSLEDLIQLDTGKFARFYLRQMKKLKKYFERIEELVALEMIVADLRDKNENLTRNVKELENDRDKLLGEVEALNKQLKNLKEFMKN